MGRVKSARRFTLIELLVVVAIIAILAAMLLPALQKAKSKVTSSVCGNNLKTQGIAMMMYVEDNADTLPWAWYSTKDTADYGINSSPWQGYGGNSFALQILPYVQSVDIFQCDAYGINDGRRELEEWNARTNYGFTGTMSWPMSYTLNGKPALTLLPYKVNPYLGSDGYGFGILNGASCAGWNVTARKLGRDLVRAESKVLIYDAGRAWSPYATSPGCANVYYVGAADGDRSLFGNYQTGQEHWRPNIGLWHQFRSNVLFFDNHVELQDKYSPYTYLDLNDTYWKIGK